MDIKEITARSYDPIVGSCILSIRRIKDDPAKESDACFKSYLIKLIHS